MDLVTQLNTSLSGRYVIDREIGRGGMATVYLTRDLRHDRRVALKVLNPELGAVLGIDRFIAEIKVTANLQHPNLLSLFDSGEADGHFFYVMPFVDGESLRSRLAREKQLPVDEALRITTAIAGALDYAHRHGVIHRDLKPENILLHEGQPLVADFGIALAVTNAGGARITQSGISLGTPQYMSPEQATGDRAIDGRTDIYSLGAVLYEMLVGDPPHMASTVQAVAAKVLTEKPHSVRTTRPSVPSYVDAAVARALEKLPADRFATAQELVDALSAKREHDAAVIAGSASASGQSRRAMKVGVKAVYAALLPLAAAIGFGVARWQETAQSQPVLRVLLALPKDVRFNDALAGPNIAVSPQGDRVAYIAIASNSLGELSVRATNQLTPKLLYTGQSIRTPAFSPDGKWLAFAEGKDIKKVSIEGGPVELLSSLPVSPYGLSWGSAGVLVAGTSSTGLYVLPERGGPSRLIPKAETDGANMWPVFLSNGNDLAYLVISAASATEGRLYVRSVRGGAPVGLGLTSNMPLGYVAGQLIYSVPGGALMAVPFDLRRRTLKGQQIQVEQDVVAGDPFFGAKAALSASGTLVFRSERAENQPVLTRGEAVTPIPLELRDFSTPRFSPDGKRVAFTVSSAQSSDIWVLDRTQAQGPLTRLTSGSWNTRPEWTADGRRILFISNRAGENAIWWQPADASGPAELLYQPVERDPFEGLISPDGKWLIYRTGSAGHPARSIFAVEMDRKGKSVPLVADGSPAQMPRLSPNGRWLAYRSGKSGRYEVYVRPFPDSGPRLQVSTEGGGEPLWSRSGELLFYRSPRGIMSVNVSTGAPFAVGDRKLAISGDFLTNESHANYDVVPDGTGFLMLQHAGEGAQTIMVHNWVRELTARTSTPR
jgi:serine/threonine-protein kinase